MMEEADGYVTTQSLNDVTTQESDITTDDRDNIEENVEDDNGLENDSRMTNVIEENERKHQEEGTDMAGRMEQLDENQNTLQNGETDLPSYRQSTIDSDIVSHVKKNSTKLSGENPLRYLPAPQRQSLNSWLALQIQNERHGWKQRVDTHMREIEKLRKSALLTNVILQRLNDNAKDVLLQAGCDVIDDMDVEENISKMAEICSFLIDDQSRCYSMLVTEKTQESRTLSEILNRKMHEYKIELQKMEKAKIVIGSLTEEAEPDVVRNRKRKPPRPKTPEELELKTQELKAPLLTPKLHKEKTPVLMKEKSALVRNTIFTFDKMSLKMLVEGVNSDGPMQKARRYHELETKIESLQDKVQTLEHELDRRGREITKYKSNIRMLKRMYHYDTAPSPSRNKRRDNKNSEINGLAVKHTMPNLSLDDNNSSDSMTMASMEEMNNTFGNAKTSVSRCLRCQRLYRLQDNHKRACHYHSKAKKKFEKYTSTGRLINVIFIWECCKRDGDAEGCCKDQHI